MAASKHNDRSPASAGLRLVFYCTTESTLSEITDGICASDQWDSAMGMFEELRFIQRSPPSAWKGCS